MKKFFFCVSLVLTGLMTGCIDKNEPVDADTKPSWLGGSIYQELKNPDQSRLTGTFNTYLRLVDDLGLDETLNRTGSKTVFPANDEAFARFFQSNEWGVTSYEQLTDAQKKLLLYNSMLDNALLLNMLSNMSNTSNGQSSTMKGMAVKHQTNASVIDSVQYILDGRKMPQNNKYWDKYRNKGIYVVSDATRPMMVHFTREHMLQNGITTLGENSDFATLTGTPYSEGTAYIFGDRVINGDVTCLNGYVHQMEDVIVPPGNMGEVLRRGSDTKFFSRILDYYAVPFYTSAVTNDYKAWLRQQGSSMADQIDSIYQIRYLSKQTGHVITNDPDGNLVSSTSVLDFDPGWNQYSPQQSTSDVDYAISDIGAMFVPVDAAVEEFFLEGGDGAYLIDIYGDKPNTLENLNENLDSLQSKRPDILTYFVRNLMKPSFTNTVPSKFSGIQNDAQENMGMKVSLLQQKSDGKYDIVIANNGVIYKLKEMIAPDRYQSVMAPPSTYLDMQVMNWAITDPDASDANKLNVGFSYYLLAMSANFGFFVPDDEAFSYFFIDPTSLGHQQPEALKFYYDASTRTTLHCDRYAYDPETGEVGDRIGEASISRVKSLLVDILNYHTVVLDEGERIGDGGKRFYKTKHGGEIMVNGGTEGTQVYGGQQIDNGLTPATIENIYNEKNGRTYRIDRVLQPPVNSVSKTLNSYDRFSEFYGVCAGFSAAKDLMAWAGISADINDFGISPQDAFTIFTSDRGSGSSKVTNSCLDENVKMFNTYNYTLYAPNNTAMETAYAAGLPRWSEIEALYSQYQDAEEGDDEAEMAKARAYAMICALRDFARYHFQSLSVYADRQPFSQQIYQSLSRDELGIAIDLKVTGEQDRLIVKDVAGVDHLIDANDASRVSNKMARDYWFDSARTSATSIYTSSFCAVHEITEPFYVYENKRFDAAWRTRAAMARTQKQYKQLKKQNKL